MNMKMNRLAGLLFCLLTALTAPAQTPKPLPTLHVEGRWLVDTHGNHVVLHGVMDTPNMYFNGWKWGSPWGNPAVNYDANGVTKCLAYFEKLFTAMEKAKCNVFRLHMDPAWTNDPNITQTGTETGEANISQFSEARYRQFLPTLYLKLAEMAMNHGLYVVVRPPGVCPGNLKVGDSYQAYLLKVWDIFSQQTFVKQHPGQISIELANEPVNLRNANNQDDAKALHDYFQPMVNKIRSNGFTGIIWAPGTTWQQNYRSYAEYPIEGANIGYAVHDYCGWYGCSDANPDAQNKIDNFHASVPVIDFAPVIITEVDWSPTNPNGQGHYDEQNNWVLPNYGTWATGSTSKWGAAYKAMLDHFQNISMTLSGTGCLLDIDAYLQTGYVVPAFNGLAEACGKACMDWYADYYNKDFPRADNEVESGAAYTVTSLTASATSFELVAGEQQYFTLTAHYADGHVMNVTDEASYTIQSPATVQVNGSYLKGLNSGTTQVTATYQDRTGQQKQIVLSVKVKGFDDWTSLTGTTGLNGKVFAIMGADDNRMFYGSDNQNLAFDVPSNVLSNASIVGYCFKAELITGYTDRYLLRLITLAGGEYSLWGSPGYLNSQAATGWCSFILGVKNQYGEDIENGAAWDISYVANKGFTLKNVGTGLYLKDNGPAKYSSPAYFNFRTQNEASALEPIVVQPAAARQAVYNLQGQRVGTADRLAELPRGIYIVGGKKVLVR